MSQSTPFEIVLIHPFGGDGQKYPYYLFTQ